MDPPRINGNMYSRKVNRMTAIMMMIDDDDDDSDDDDDDDDGDEDEDIGDDGDYIGEEDDDGDDERHNEQWQKNQRCQQKKCHLICLYKVLNFPTNRSHMRQGLL